MDVLCLGAAVIDIMAVPIPEYENIQEKQRIENISLNIGGDAANQSVRLADLGHEVQLLSAVGHDTCGAVLKGMLFERNVKTDYMAVTELPTVTSLVLVNESGNRNTFSVSGAYRILGKTDVPDAGILKAEGFKAVTIGSLFQLPAFEKDGMLAFLKALKKAGITVFADLGSDKEGLGLDGIRAFLPFIDYFLPSHYDAMKMTGKDSPEEAAEVYRNCGASGVVIKCGGRGCYYVNDDERGWAAAPEVKTVDTTGAGDCMAALLIHRILEGDSLSRACRYACMGASLSTLYKGACTKALTVSEIDLFIRHQEESN